MGEIWLIRHGQASFGAADYDRLSELGFEQSRRLGRWLADSGQRFDLAVTGSHRRHRETAESCLDALNSHCARIEDSGLDEYNHREMLSRYEPGLATPQAVREFIDAQSNPRRAFQELFAAAFARWIGGKHDAEYRESFAGFRRRCLEALHLRIVEAGRSERIIIFTSGGPIAIIAQSVLGLPDDRVAALNFSLVNAAVTTLFFGSSGLTLSTLNSFQHLEGSPSGRLVTYR
jgi:broad specificity phosphatase PhoE